MSKIAIYCGVALDSSGNAIASADVEVRREDTGALASIWSDEDGTVALANPSLAFTDANGRFQFYVAGLARGYSVKVTKAADTYTLHNQAIGIAAQFDFSTYVASLVAAASAAAMRLLLGFSAIAAKGDLLAGTAADTIGTLTAGSNGKAVAADSSQTTGLVYIDNPSRPNLLINPNWQLDQINEGALYTVNATDVRGPDGWSGDAVGAGVFKLRTLADPDNAALKCLEISCTTADASIAATDRYEVWTAVEGYDAAALQLGIASAVPFTYQFKLKSNAVTGVFGVYFANSAGNRFYAGTITVADTSEHEYSVSLTGDLTGTWLYTNGIGLRMGLVLAAGSNFQGTAGAWTASTVRTTSSQANFMSANTNIIYLKRGQLMQSALVQAYKPADIQRELAKAQRYYSKTFSQGTAPAQNVGSIGGAFSAVGVNTTLGPGGMWVYPTVMRAAPTVVTYNPFVADANWRNNANTTSNTVSVGTPTDRGSQIASSTTNGTDNFYIHATANARLS